MFKMSEVQNKNHKTNDEKTECCIFGARVWTLKYAADADTATAENENLTKHQQINYWWINFGNFSANVYFLLFKFSKRNKQNRKSQMNKQQSTSTDMNCDNVKKYTHTHIRKIYIKIIEKDWMRQQEGV